MPLYPVQHAQVFRQIVRKPTLTEHAAQILPYRGLGSGIPRALREWPRIDLLDDVVGNQFSAVVWRSEVEWESRLRVIDWRTVLPRGRAGF